MGLSCNKHDCGCLEYEPASVPSLVGAFGIPDRCTDCGARSTYAIKNKGGTWEAYCLKCATPEVVASGEQAAIQVRNALHEGMKKALPLPHPVEMGTEIKLGPKRDSPMPGYLDLGPVVTPIVLVIWLAIVAVTTIWILL
jgi:hypothetical protein